MLYHVDNDVLGEFIGIESDVRLVTSVRFVPVISVS